MNRRKTLLSLLNRAGIEATDGARNIKVCCPMAPYSGLHSKIKDSRPSMGVLYADHGSFKVNCFTCGYRSSRLSQLFEDLYHHTKDEIFLKFLDESVSLEEINADGVLALADQISFRKSIKRSPVIDEELYRRYWGIYHPYWDQRGIGSETARIWEAGFDSTLGRVTLPIRCSSGKLRGATGRAVDEDVRPKYYNYWDMQKGEWLLGEHLVKGSCLILVEGPFDAVMGYQHLKDAGLLGEYSILALMGATITDKQVHTLVRLGSELLLFLDRDDAGSSGAESIYKKMFGRMIVSSVSWGSSQEKDPASCGRDKFIHLVQNSKYL